MKRTCLKSGRWSGDLPKCIKIIPVDFKPTDSVYRISNGKLLVSMHLHFDCCCGQMIVCRQIVKLLLYKMPDKIVKFEKFQFYQKQII